MILFAIALLCLSGLVALVSGLWTLALAFQRDVKWGLAVLLVPFGNVAFLVADWREARLPFFVGLASLILMGSAFLHLPHDSLTAPFRTAIAAVQTDHAERQEVTEKIMESARLDADRQLQLINLKRREAALSERKAKLAAEDQAGAERLSDDIRKYNADLKPALAQLK